MDCKYSFLSGSSVFSAHKKNRTWIKVETFRRDPNYEVTTLLLPMIFSRAVKNGFFISPVTGYQYLQTVGSNDASDNNFNLKLDFFPNANVAV